MRKLQQHSTAGPEQIGALLNGYGIANPAGAGTPKTDLQAHTAFLNRCQDPRWLFMARTGETMHPSKLIGASITLKIVTAPRFKHKITAKERVGIKL